METFFNTDVAVIGIEEEEEEEDILQLSFQGRGGGVVEVVIKATDKTCDAITHQPT